MSESIKVLLVEDSEGDVLHFKRMLLAVSAHISVKAVARLVDAFHAIEQEKFDVILLDLNLLDVDGVVSVAALHAEFPDIPIIVYSGMDDAKLKEAALMCGAKRYLVKGQESPYALKFLIEDARAN